MDPEEFDVAIFGSGPLCWLLAVSLAARHGQRTALIGVPYSAHRLPIGIPSALPLATRPEAWDMLRGAEQETLSLLSEMDATGAAVRGDVKIVADQPSRANELAHLRHLALAYGATAKAERVSRGADLPATYGFGHVAQLDEARLQPAVFAWLRKHDVAILSPVDTKIARQRNGSVLLTSRDRQVSAKRMVLADDAAIVTHLKADARPAVLRIVDAQVTLTAETTLLEAPIVDYPDRGVTLYARGKRILARVRGFANVDERLGSCLGERLPLGRTATRRFQIVETVDGAPLTGLLKSQRLFIAAGLGDAGPFFAPVFARLLAGHASPEERAWLAAREPARIDSRIAVADLAPAVFA